MRATAFEIKPYPEFSWPIGRQHKLDQCPRAYFSQYHLGWNGWLGDAPTETRVAYRLGKLTSLDALLGQHHQPESGMNPLVGTQTLEGDGCDTTGLRSRRRGAKHRRAAADGQAHGGGIRPLPPTRVAAPPPRA